MLDLILEFLEYEGHADLDQITEAVNHDLNVTKGHKGTYKNDQIQKILDSYVEKNLISRGFIEGTVYACLGYFLSPDTVGDY